MRKHLVLGILIVVICVFFTACESNDANEVTRTSPTPTASMEPAAEYVDEETTLSQAETILADMSLDEKIGQLFMVNLEELDPSQGSYYNFTKITASMKQNIKKYKVGGIQLESRNIETKEQLLTLIQNLQKSSDYPMYLSTVEEGGEHSICKNCDNLKGTVYPSACQMGATKTAEEVYVAGRTMGKELRTFGFNVNMAPVADIADINNNAYVSRCFSEKEETTTELVAQMTSGLKDSGMGIVLKHFPGIGSVTGKIGESLANNESSLSKLRSQDFLPFQAGIEAGAEFIMVTNASVSKVTQNTEPACLSQVIVGKMLRDELGYEGLIMTDSQSVPIITEKYTAGDAAIRAIKAGNDIILSPANLGVAFEGVKTAISDRSLDSKLIDASVLRILKDKIKRGIIPLEQSSSTGE